MGTGSHAQSQQQSDWRSSWVRDWLAAVPRGRTPACLPACVSVYVLLPCDVVPVAAAQPVIGHSPHMLTGCLSVLTCAVPLAPSPPSGDERIKDKGLNCTYIIARRPENQPTSERAIPISIFSAEPAVARSWLRKWCGDLGSGACVCVCGRGGSTALLWSAVGVPGVGCGTRTLPG